jgi:hypothetical protein
MYFIIVESGGKPHKSAILTINRERVIGFPGVGGDGGVGGIGGVPGGVESTGLSFGTGGTGGIGGTGGSGFPGSGTGPLLLLRLFLPLRVIFKGNNQSAAVEGVALLLFLQSALLG